MFKRGSLLRIGTLFLEAQNSETGAGESLITFHAEVRCQLAAGATAAGIGTWFSACSETCDLLLV